MIIIIISFIDNLALFYLSLDGTLFPDVYFDHCYRILCRTF